MVEIDKVNGMHQACRQTQINAEDLAKYSKISKY